MAKRKKYHGHGMKQVGGLVADIQRSHRQEISAVELFTIQHCIDLMQIAANEEFGFGPERNARLEARFRKVLLDFSVGAIEDSKDDRDVWYSKGKLDQALQRVNGRYFRPWEERHR